MKQPGVSVHTKAFTSSQLSQSLSTDLFCLWTKQSNWCHPWAVLQTLTYCPTCCNDMLAQTRNKSAQYSCWNCCMMKALWNLIQAALTHCLLLMSLFLSFLLPWIINTDSRTTKQLGLARDCSLVVSITHWQLSTAFFQRPTEHYWSHQSWVCGEPLGPF